MHANQHDTIKNIITRLELLERQQDIKEKNYGDAGNLVDELMPKFASSLLNRTRGRLRSLPYLFALTIPILFYFSMRTVGYFLEAENLIIGTLAVGIGISLSVIAYFLVRRLWNEQISLFIQRLGLISAYERIIKGDEGQQFNQMQGALRSGDWSEAERWVEKNIETLQKIHQKNLP